MKPIFFKPAAIRALRRIPANTARRIAAKIEAYAEDPACVGDWRVIMQDKVVLDVLDIGPRGGGIYD